jgi:hypothetical protein
MKSSDFVKLDQLAKEIGIKERTLREWRKDKGMPVIEIGKVTRVYRPNFLKWFASFENKEGGDGNDKQGSLLPGMRKI